MKRLSRATLLLPASLLALAAEVAAQDVRVNLGTLEDRRTTGPFFAGLSVEISLVGEELEEVRGARALVRQAVDDTGQSLLPEQAREPDFDTPSGSGPAKLKLELRNPARRASTIREISGQLELFLPGRDPASRVRVERILGKRDKKLSAPGLKAAGIEARLISPEAYRASRKKAEAELDEKLEAEKEEARRQGTDTAELEAMVGLFKGLSGLMGEVGENDLILEIQDEGKRIFGIQAVTVKGEPIDSQGSMTSGNLRILNFREKVPADAALLFLLKTKKALVSVPFWLKDVHLP